MLAFKIVLTHLKVKLLTNHIYISANKCLLILDEIVTVT